MAAIGSLAIRKKRGKIRDASAGTCAALVVGMHLRSFASAFVAASLLAEVASAADTWTNPYDGVKRLRRTETGPNQVIHALVVDLTVPHMPKTSTSRPSIAALRPGAASNGQRSPMGTAS